MLLYVPAGVLGEVLIVNVAATDPFDGTLTDGDDQEAVAPGICGDQFRAAGTTVPLNPEALVNVTV